MKTKSSYDHELYQPQNFFRKSKDMMIEEPKSSSCLSLYNDSLRCRDRYISKPNTTPLRICDVCLSMQDNPSNLLYYCSGCRSYVHRGCYGYSQEQPNFQDPWSCQRCQMLQTRRITEEDITCVFCPDIRGIMKLFNKTVWAHISCIQWSPDLYFTDSSKKGINFKNFNENRFRKLCYICKRKVGACLSCDENNCDVSFHVRCARTEGIIRPIEDMIETMSEMKDIRIRIYCIEHLDSYDKRAANKICMEKAFYDQLGRATQLVKPGTTSIQMALRFHAVLPPAQKMSMINLIDLSNDDEDEREEKPMNPISSIPTLNDRFEKRIQDMKHPPQIPSNKIVEIIDLEEDYFSIPPPKVVETPQNSIGVNIQQSNVNSELENLHLPAPPKLQFISINSDVREFAGFKKIDKDFFRTNIHAFFEHFYDPASGNFQFDSNPALAKLLKNETIVEKSHLFDRLLESKVVSPEHMDGNGHYAHEMRKSSHANESCGQKTGGQDKTKVKRPGKKKRAKERAKRDLEEGECLNSNLQKRTHRKIVKPSSNINSNCQPISKPMPKEPINYRNGKDSVEQTKQIKQTKQTQKNGKAENSNAGRKRKQVNEMNEAYTLDQFLDADYQDSKHSNHLKVENLQILHELKSTNLTSMAVKYKFQTLGCFQNMMSLVEI
eukprot:TRINITY_DN4377_c0_g2_i3.p1 TRINITY_DN4377_c0_g2~~TRINITY_DN4377_c0_g2_i3.p1  ORF type:complete len:664 (-),score=70.73 TRINITY_DN4377_c0_g2_i3:91-2082(-)